ncbi:MAG: IS630 family transposase [Flavobacteriales bacterium]|nr:IS630 family transposase [Flavobacteriales bacterium]
MNKPDARRLSDDSLRLLRMQADRLRREHGKTWREIAEIVGVHIGTVISWARRFNVGSADGSAAPDSGKRGRRFGEGRSISGVDEMFVRDQVVGKNPDQLQLPFALWSRRAVQALIQQVTKVDMPIRTVGLYLQRWGMTPQRPIKRALEQRPADVEHWLATKYPHIQARAKAENAEIYWADETAVKQDTAWVRGYAPAGKTPILPHAARWSHVTMISAVTNQGLVRFAFHQGAINTDRFIDFMDRLIQEAEGRKVFLILDNLRVHHARQVKAWLAERIDLIEAFYLPSYTPEANPDEYLNRDFKTALRSQEPKRTTHDLWSAARNFMEFLQRTPERVRAYFTHPSVRYAQ